MDVRELEIRMWEAAKNRDSEAFLGLVARDAVMVCGGHRCSGADYARVVGTFDLAHYEISEFETVAETDAFCQVCYLISTTVSDSENADLAGRFWVTSTWKKDGGTGRLVFNMDSRVPS